MSSVHEGFDPCLSQRIFEYEKLDVFEEEWGSGRSVYPELGVKDSRTGFGPEGRAVRVPSRTTQKCCRGKVSTLLTPAERDSSLGHDPTPRS